MTTYTIYKIGVHGKYSKTGYTNVSYFKAMYGLKDILKSYRDDAARGQKGKNERVNRFKICVCNGSDEYAYEAIKD